VFPDTSATVEQVPLITVTSLQMKEFGSIALLNVAVNLMVDVVDGSDCSAARARETVRGVVSTVILRALDSAERIPFILCFAVMLCSPDENGCVGVI